MSESDGARGGCWSVYGEYSRGVYLYRIYEYHTVFG